MTGRSFRRGPVHLAKRRTIGRRDAISLETAVERGGQLNLPTRFYAQQAIQGYVVRGKKTRSQENSIKTYDGRLVH